MTITIITGSGGLIGSESAHFFAGKTDKVIGIDNDMRAYFFGQDASTAVHVKRLKQSIDNYRHVSIDIRDEKALKKIFAEYDADIKYIIHAAAQPSHDWAAKEPKTDFTINANATLNLLECTRQFCPEAVFVLTSTNKVYGDTPNRLPLIETDSRYELPEDHCYYQGIDETMSVDHTLHSLFGASKLAGDMLAQEYGRYFSLKTGIFRGGCLTGQQHAGAELHGFLAYLVKCLVTEKPYTVFGYQGKQVRDNIHSYDLVNAIWHFCQNPGEGEVYNIGGARHSNCSMLEAITRCEQLTGKKLNWQYSNTNRIGDHQWWISDIGKFQQHYPNWQFKYTLDDIYSQIITATSS